MKSLVAQRFRGFLPVVVDVETAGFNSQTDALLEIAAVILNVDEETGEWYPESTHAHHVLPFEGANLEPEALKFIGMTDPYHPFRMAVAEDEALREVFKPIRSAVKRHGCSRAILVGHNAPFDLSFVNAAIKRTDIKRSPFHQFSCFDTVSLSALAFGQTVLSRAAMAAGLKWDNAQAHSAVYDAEQTALLFCEVVNRWDSIVGLQTTSQASNP